jgi:hypothetical protein
MNPFAPLRLHSLLLTLGLAQILAAGGVTCRAQNIVPFERDGKITPPLRLTERRFDELISPAIRLGPVTNQVAAQPILDRLSRHVEQFLDGAPWMPFQQTLGISGYETTFAHPDDSFFALALASAVLPEPTARRLRAWFISMLAVAPPYREDGWEFSAGRPRETHEIPDSLRRSGRGRATSLFGVYALWAYVHYAGDTNAGRTHWPAVQQRASALLHQEYRFNLTNTSSGLAEAQRLNGDLAGMIGLIRLARLNGDTRTEKDARVRGRQLLELRLNLDRVNSALLEPSRAATRSLHNARLARLLHLCPELGAALAAETEGCAVANLQAFRLRRNAWFLAYGDRLIGGENYTNPIHFPQALFAGAAFIEQLPAAELQACLDIPWCAGDMTFVEKCVLTIWAIQGRPWTQLP